MPVTRNVADPRDRLIFALDVSDATEARRVAEQLGDAVTFYKLGLELMAAGGYFELVDWLLARNKRVFADLKLFDVPATVSRAISLLAKRGITFATVHGNQGIMEAAAAAKGDLKILAVTVLTSLDRGDLTDLGFQCDVEALVLSRARRALEAGCDGVVASGLELPAMRRAIDRRLLVVTPGIANLIRENKIFRITSSIQTGSKHGMMLLDDNIFNLWREGLITKEDGLAKCNNAEELAQRFAVAERGMFDDQPVEQEAEPV